MNKYSLNCKVRKEGDTQENISLFADTYNLKVLSKDDLKFAYNQFYNERDKKVIKYINEFKENFSKKQYQKFLDFKKTHNVKDNSSKGSNCYSVIEYCEHTILGDKFNDFRF